MSFREALKSALRPIHVFRAEEEKRLEANTASIKENLRKLELAAIRSVTDEAAEFQANVRT